MSERLRVITFNVLALADANGQRRQEVARRVLAGLRPDVVALQEVTRRPGFDQAGYLLGPDYTVVGLPGQSSNHTGECLASLWQVGEVTTLDVPVTTGGPHRATAVAAEILVPPPRGPLLVVHHRATYELPLEEVREQQALATARFVEDLVAGRGAPPVVLLGDFNAEPESASIRFLTGRQSLAGVSVRYEDAWEMAHPGAPGHTFSPRNPLVTAGQMPSERGRRIDRILIRSAAYGPPLDVTDCRLVLDEPMDGVWASDHFGVLADLEPPRHRPGTWA